MDMEHTNMNNFNQQRLSNLQSPLTPPGSNDFDEECLTNLHIPPTPPASVDLPHTPPSSTPPSPDGKHDYRNSPQPLSDFELKLRDESTILRDLIEAKQSDADSIAVSKHYEKKEKNFLSGGPSNGHQSKTLQMFEDDAQDQFGEVVLAAHGKDGIKTFLDLGAAPGGWSSWLLKTFEKSRGVGVELPKKDGGREILLLRDKKLQGRYRSFDKNLLESIDDNSAIAGKLPASMDLVCAGAIPNEVPRDSPQAKLFHTSPAAVLLTLNQLYLAFQYLKPGGTFICFAWKKAFLVNCELLVLLRTHFTQLVPCKGSKPFGTKSTYQLVATGFHFENQSRAEGLERVKKAIRTLQSFPPEHKARDNGVLLLDGTEDEIFEREKDFILKFYEPLWLYQTESIYERQRQLEGKNKEKRSKRKRSASNKSSAFSTESVSTNSD